MPIPRNSTRDAIINMVAERIHCYNTAQTDYNVTYGNFMTARSNGIAQAGSIAKWLTTPDAANAVLALLGSFGMKARKSELVELEVFAYNLARVPGVPLLEAASFPVGTISTFEPQLRDLFNYCAAQGTFSKSGGFVIGSKTAHCIFPKLCPIIDGAHIGISLYNVAQG